MAEQPLNTAISAVYPAPPPFYKYFTEQNLERLQKLQGAEEIVQSNDTTQKSNILTNESLSNLPPDQRAELHYLIPPPPPPSDTYTSFGETRSVSSSSRIPNSLLSQPEPR